MKKFLNVRTTFWLRIILLLCGIMFNASVLNSYRNVRSDFVQDYVAAHSLRLGSSLYGEDIKKLENEMLGFKEPQNFHPPFNAILFFPLSFFSYQTASVILGIVSLMLLLLINQLVVKGLKLNGEWFLNITCFSLYWHPVFYCLANGQSSMIISACLIGGWFCLRFEKSWVAGFLFAIATLIKLFPGLVLLYLFLMKNWRTFFSTIFFIVIGLTLTAFCVGIDDMRTYSVIMIAKDVNEWKGFVLNHSVSGMVTRIFSDTGWTEPLVQLPQINHFLIFLLNSSILIYSILKMSKIAAKQELGNYAFGLTMVAMLLLCPITWGHIFPVLILPIGLLLNEYIDKPTPRKLSLLLFILICVSLPDVIIARGLMAIHHPFRMPWYSMLVTLVPGVGLLLLWLELSRRMSIPKY